MSRIAKLFYLLFYLIYGQFKGLYELLQRRIIMSYSVRLWQRKDRINQDGTALIFIRVTIDRKKKCISTGISVPVSMWNEKEQRVKPHYKDSRKIQVQLDEQAESVRKKLERQEILGLPVSLLLFGKEGQANPTTIRGFFENQVFQLRDKGKIGSSIKYKYCLKLLAETNKVDVPFSYITPNYISKFIDYLKDRGNSPNSIATKYGVLRAVFNKACYAGLAVQDDSPFNHIHVSWTKTRKRAIKKEDIDRIKRVELDEDQSVMSISFSRDIFLFSYYSAGINFKDIATLKYRDINEGIIYYKRHKTGKEMSFPLTTSNMAVMKKYLAPHPHCEDYIFPILDRKLHQTAQQIFNRVHKVLGRVNMNLHILAKKAGTPAITTYVARHTYATVLKRAGVDVSIISETLGHSDISTTQIYLDSFENDQIVAAMKNL